MRDMVNILIDGKACLAPAGTTVLAAAGLVGVDIPHFCFHPAFEPEGSCRMCLVEIEGLPKLELACSAVVKEGMKILTASPQVVQARKEVLEFLLAEHPLDCPVCDKAGECRLQDYYELHGLHGGRFGENKKRKAKLVRIGKTLILDRERCILCIRCVRFLRTVTRSGELGVFERGHRSEIGIYDDCPVTNGYAGNLAEICPVGAITDSEFRFKTRAWFLEKKPGLCPLCGRGCNIVLDSVEGHPLPEGERRIFRIRAAENHEVNGFWICDLGRAGHQDITRDRRLRIRGNPGREPRERAIGWNQAIKIAAKKIQSLFRTGQGARLSVVLSGFLTNEELRLCRTLFVDALEVRRVHFADPKEGDSDGLLLTAERVPNRRGAREAGFAPAPPNLDVLAASGDCLFIFGPHLSAHFEGGALAAALNRIGFKILLTPHHCTLDGLADMIFPTALTAEKTGSFTNIDGLTQTFAAALAPPGDCLPESEILKRLAGELGVRLE